MLRKCKAIVLKKTKYSENSIIVNVYTDNFGKLSLIISGIRSKKSKKAALFHNLSILNVDIYYKASREIQRIKEVHAAFPATSITSNISKNAIAFFISEFMLKVLREYEENIPLFEFIENSVKTLDLLHNSKQISNFHIIFLAMLSKYLGISPVENYSEQNLYFNLEKARFVNLQDNNPLIISKEISTVLNKIIKADYQTSISLNRENRNLVLNSLIDFYNFHLDTKLHIKSIDVLNEVFG